MQDFCLARKVFGEDFLYERHVNYLLKSLRKSTYGTPLDVAEAHRLSSLFFVVSGLDLLGALDTRLTRADKDEIIEWIYSYQIDVNKVKLPPDSLKCDINQSATAELSTTTTILQPSQQRNNHHQQPLVPPTQQESPLSRLSGNCLNSNQKQQQAPPTSELTNSDQQREYSNNTYYNTTNNSINNDDNNHSQTTTATTTTTSIDFKTKRIGHSGFRATSMLDGDIPLDCGVLSMTYCALSTLVILGDNLERVDRKSIIAGLRQLQLPDGSFKPSVLGGESDMRLVYCACAVSKFLNDWSGMDKDKCVEFIKSSLSYEGAFGQCPGAEAHGGSTYCALASLKLMSKLNDALNREEIDQLIRWCVNRLDNGFSGRPNKDQDTCYSFWIGASLVMLDHFQFIEQKNLLDFMLLAQEERGGLSKVPDFYSDPLHTYLGFAGLTFIDDDLCLKRRINLLKLDATLNISARARSFLDKIHDSWKAKMWLDDVGSESVVTPSPGQQEEIEIMR